MNWSIAVAVLTWIGLAGFGVATLAYWILAPWHRTRMGRNFMFMLLTVTFTMTLVVLARFIPNEARIFLGIVIYGLFAVSGIAFATTIISEQLSNRHKNKNSSNQKLD